MSHSSEAGPSSTMNQKEKKIRMVGDRPETKEERKARKAERRAKKAAQAEEPSVPAQETVNNDSQAAETVEESNVKAKKRVEFSDEPARHQQDTAVSVDAQAKESEKEKKKKDKKSKKEKSIANADESVPIDADSPTITPSEPAGAAPRDAQSNKTEKKDKKEKKRKREQDNEPAEAPVEEKSKKQQRREARAAKPQPVKKELRADLVADSSLTDAGRKAMQYVYEFTDSKSNNGQGWKFNKANQNWLIRNVWDDAEVPDKYLDHVLSYLKTVQGGARQTAEKHVNPSQPEPIVSEESKADPSADSTAAEGETAPVVESDTGAKQESAEEVAEKAAKAEMLKIRGEKLLAALA